MDGSEFERLQIRLSHLEDRAAITQLILSYGPAADAGLASFAGRLWLEDGIYDWDAEGEPHQGCAAVEAMLKSDGHQGLMARGVAHFGGPPVIEIHGDRATALNYSLIMRNEGDRFYLWRVSAVRWDLERADSAGGYVDGATGSWMHRAAGVGCSVSPCQKCSKRPPREQSTRGQGCDHHGSKHGSGSSYGHSVRARRRAGAADGASGGPGA